MARKGRKLHYPDSNFGSIFPPHNLLVFEGNEEFHTFFAMFEKLKMLEKFHVDQGGGYENLWNDLPVLLQQSDLRRIGIVVDADNEPLNRWTSLCNRLMDDECGYADLPETLEPNGTIVRQQGRPVLGLWMMPDNRSSGALEEFIRFLIPSEDVLWSYAEKVVADLPPLPYPDSEGRANWEAKARIQSWLAWQEEPGKPIGQAITKGFLDPKVTEVQVFIEWLRLLFELS